MLTPSGYVAHNQTLWLLRIYSADDSLAEYNFHVQDKITV